MSPHGTKAKNGRTLLTSVSGPKAAIPSTNPERIPLMCLNAPRVRAQPKIRG
jgi:hypothetical protein